MDRANIFSEFKGLSSKELLKSVKEYASEKGVEPRNIMEKINRGASSSESLENLLIEDRVWEALGKYWAKEEKELPSVGSKKGRILNILKRKFRRMLAQLFIFLLPNESWEYFDRRYNWLDISNDKFYSIWAEELVTFLLVTHSFFFFLSVPSLPPPFLWYLDCVGIGIIFAGIVMFFSWLYKSDLDLRSSYKKDRIPEYTLKNDLYFGYFLFEILFHALDRTLGFLYRKGRRWRGSVENLADEEREILKRKKKSLAQIAKELSEKKKNN